MKNFTKELKDILTEEAGAPILSPDEVRSRANTMVILTNQAPKELLAIAGPSRQAILLNYKPLMITFPDQRGVYKVQPDDIVFENHHSGRDVTEAGSQETSYEKFFASAMKKFGVSSPIELSPDETKKFFNYVDKNWKAEEESDGSKNEILPALAAVGAAGLAGAGMAAGGIAQGVGSAVGGIAKGVGSAIGAADTEDSNEIAPAVAAGLGAVGAGAADKVMDRIGLGDDNEAQQARAPIAGKSMQNAAQQTANSLVARMVGDENESGCGDGWEDPPRLGGEPSMITPMENDDNEDVSTGKVGKKDKGGYKKAYKLALKKYKIHSADELDTPAERKGFTDYVDRLWKGGEVHESGCSCESCAVNEVSREEKARRKKAIGKETEKELKKRRNNQTLIRKEKRTANKKKEM